MPSEADLRYMAGVFDAGASYTVTGGNDRVRQMGMICVGRIERDVQRWLLVTAGGFSGRREGYEMLQDRKGCSEHCPEPHVHMRGTIRRPEWRVQGFTSYIILENLRPYLRGWNEQAQRIIDIESPCVTTARKKTRESLERLGWRIP